MRVMLRARMDTRLGNEAIKNGTLPKTVQSLIERLKPEAAYFTALEGRRTCTLVFDMQDTSQIPSIAEPLFQSLGAEIEIVPVMNLDDLQKGLSAL
ncbi:DUF3303 family protein [Actinomadura opuntiae]|uniref:DUF3303 family protein n=1 Tax=Actinomadura sp. OS1-43 TaxID=604315 RepID=UPI00255ABD7D|nr:DUF3303 family protein [Actinomadura sp. OS1-43]MDL4821314.1 hypothetical protein [Actinomadura sp. OS1-43]